MITVFLFKDVLIISCEFSNENEIFLRNLILLKRRKTWPKFDLEYSMKITIPTDWSDVTVRQFQELAKVPELEYDDLDKQLKVLEILGRNFTRIIHRYDHLSIQ